MFRLLDYAHSRNSWSADIKKIFCKMHSVDNFENRLPFSTVRAWDTLHDLNCINWKNTVMNSPKLRTYKCYKDVSCIEPYTRVLANRKLRSIIF